MPSTDPINHFLHTRVSYSKLSSTVSMPYLGNLNLLKQACQGPRRRKGELVADHEANQYGDAIAIRGT